MQKQLSRIPLTIYPHAVERDYFSFILKTYKTWFDYLIHSLSFGGLKFDAVFDARIFDNARSKWNSLIEAAKDTISKVASKVNQVSFVSFAKQFKTAKSVDLFRSEPWLKDEVKAFTAENVRLIKGIGTQTADRIQTLVTDAVKKGESAKTTLKEALMKEFDYGENRAALIARDQVGKLNGEITRIRQTAAGVEEYTWTTVGDSRVRPAHQHLNGKVFSWDNPPSEGHPGQPIRCRCIAQPIFK
jgi:SPP1 gp7 family putative phage head morphogenesis protein